MDFNNVPPNAMLAIFMLSDYKSLLRMKVVSKNWNVLFPRHQQFWREKFEMEFGEWEGGDVDFEKEYKMEYGWKFKEPRVVELEGHEGRVCDVKANGSTLVSGSQDKNVQVWDLERMECVHEFHLNREVFSLALHKDRILVGMGNGEIRVWSTTSWELQCWWQAHRSPILSLSGSRNRLMSTDFFVMKIWNASFGLVVESPIPGCFTKFLFIDGEFHGVTSRYNNVCYKADGTIYRMKIENHVSSICSNSKYIFVGCLCGQIKIWEKATFKKAAKVFAPARNVQLPRSEANGGVERSNNDHLTCTRNINLSMGFVASIHCTEEKLVVGSNDGRIQVLDFAC